MKSSIASFLFFLLLPLCSNAQQSAFWGLKGPPSTDDIPVIHLVKEAEVLVANVTIIASKSDALDQAEDFSKALQTLRAAVAKIPNLTIKDERTILGGGERNVYFSSIANGRLDTNHSASNLKIVHPLTAGKDSLAAADVLRSLVGSLKLPRDTAVRIDSLQLEVNEIENLRAPLLETIAADASKLKTIFKESDLMIGGLENRVEQRPLNNHQVAVFIPYALSIGSGRKN